MCQVIYLLCQIFFLGLIASCALLLLPQIWHSMTNTKRTIISLLLPPPFVFTYLAASTKLNPDLHVTPANLDTQLSHYPYDYCLYRPGRLCGTCQLPKPARSKHCSICKACVARCDHHCVWVNNCLGRGNYRWFLALLVSVSFLLFYGSYLSYSALKPEIALYRSHFPGSRSSSMGGSEKVGFARLAAPLTTRFASGSEWLQAALVVGGLSVTGVGLLATFTAPLPLGLLAYHIYLIWAGTTTNESGKWSDWRDDMYDGRAWMASMKSQKSGGPEPGNNSIYRDRGSTWPTRSQYCIVTTRDGQMPTPPWPGYLENVIDTESWRRVWRLGQVENIYDLGFLDNLVEVLQ